MFKINPKEKFRLFKQTKNFCSAPWHLLYVYTNGEIYSCNQGLQSFGNVYNGTTDIVNNSSRCSLQDEILQDIKTNNCKSCINLENTIDHNQDYGHIRSEYNKLFSKYDIDYHSEHFALQALDLHWSSLCDLKCITCWSTQSSSLALEQGEPIRHIDKQSAESLIKWIVTNQHTLKEVYLSGGEPTMIKHNLSLLQQLEKRNDLIVRVNSNLMWNQNNQIIQEILKFPNVLITCSADALEDKFEYIRRGAKWSVFIENLKFLQKFDNVKIRINSVFFVANSSSITDVIDYFYDTFSLEDFTINQCSLGHTYLRCRNLDDPMKLVAIEKINLAIKKYHNNLNLVGQLNNCLTELSYAKTEDYREYFEKIDSLANTNWKKVFNELL